MEVMVLAYLIHRAAYRVLEFFRHWYVDGFRLYWNFIIRSLQWFDQYFAGYVPWIPFWLGRILIGGIVYALFLFVAAIVFLVWLLTIPYILVRIIV